MRWRRPKFLDDLTRGTFRAFRHRNYRLFFAGQFLSLIGTWITTVATSWLVYRLTGSEFLLGVVGFANQFPSFLLAPVTGVLVDRWNRRKVLLFTQAASALQSLALAILVFSGAAEIWSICALCVLQACVNAFDMPARQTFVNEIVEDKLDLPNAIALNSAMFNGARLIGPSIGGIIIAFSNEGVCFLLDALSYLAVIYSIWQISIPSHRLTYGKHRIVEGLIEGARYVFETAPIRSVLLLVASVSLLGTPHIVLLPVFAQDVLHGGPRLLGLLMATMGCGALLGALMLASRRSILGLGSVLAACAFTLGLSLCVFSFSRVIWLSLIALFCAGASLITMLAGCNTVIQTLVDDTKRSRAMSFYLMAFMGMMPLGSLLAGVLADRFSAPTTVLLGGCAGIGISILYFHDLPTLRKLARPLYIQKGILPAESGTSAAADQDHTRIS